MSSVELKEQLHHYIDKLDYRLLNLMLAMIESDIGNEGHISIEQYNKELEEADAEIDRGEFITHQQAVNEIGGWREK